MLSHKDISELLNLFAVLNDLYSLGYTSKDKKIKDLLSQINNFLHKRSK